MTYGAKTWILTVRFLHKLKVAQGSMKKAILGGYLRDRIHEGMR